MKKCLDCNKILTNHNKTSVRCRECWKFHHSKIMKNKFSGTNNPFYGKKHSKETKNKISTIKKKLYSNIDNHPRFKGDKHDDGRGYVLLYIPNHPNKKHGNYVYEHRFVMEQYLGRYLKSEEVVHHKNDVKNDNRIENLQLMTNSEHTLLHKKRKS